MVGEADTPIGGRGTTGAVGVVGAGDPFARPFKLPSGGLYYPNNHDGTVLISPTRGEQEELLAGASEDKAARLAIFRQLTASCVNMRGIPFTDLTVPDWVAVMFNFFAISAGDDRIKLTPIHAACGRATPQIKHLTELRFVQLRRTEPGLDPNWPPKAETANELDSMLDTIAEIENEKPPEEGMVVTRVLADAEMQEPFNVNVLDGTGAEIKVAYRLLRLADLIKAEEFVAVQGERNGTPGNGRVNVNPDGALHTYLLAKQIVSINGEKMSPLKATTWVRKQLSPTLLAIRTSIATREYGYDLTPKFRCDGCQTSFRVRLPIDTNFFRGGDDS